MVKMWNPTAETMSRDEYAKVQLEGLKKSLARVWGNEFYRARLQAGGMASPEDVKSLDDLQKLPFLTKDDFREAYPLKMNCVDRQDLLEFHMSSGSTGTPVVMAYTKNDLDQWAECMARCFTMAGLEKGDAFQIMPTLRFGSSWSPDGSASSFSMRRGTYETTEQKPFTLKSRISLI